jgi:SAM-dependent methyltransferase
MEEFWEQNFKDKQRMWGEEPAEVTFGVNSLFQEHNFKNVLVPGFGYGRNAKIFMENGIDVTGIELSETAISIAKQSIERSYKIHHGSVVNMPFDTELYQGIYCYALLNLLNASERKKFIQDCYNQLVVDGIMVFVTLSIKDHRYGKGKEMGKNNFHTKHGISLLFYDLDSIAEEFEPFGTYNAVEINEPSINTGAKPSEKFWKISCRKPKEL